MKWIQALILGISILVASQIHGQAPPLRVAIGVFEPPFIMQAGNNQFYGFDISLIQTICNSLGRECQFQPMPFKNLLSAVEENQADVAISAIIITVARARRVNFSLPYLPSVSRFLATRQFSEQPYSLHTLNNQRIGIEEGSIFADQLAALGVSDATIVSYATNQELIDSLNNNKIDLILMDNPGAVFWEVKSSGLLKTFGGPLNYGFGYGIAVNLQNQALLMQINQALLNHQKTEAFKENYRIYFGNMRLVPQNANEGWRPE